MQIVTRIHTVTDIIWIVIIHIIESRGKIFIIEGVAIVVVAQVYRNGFPKTMVIIIYNTTVFDYIIYLVYNNLFFNFSFFVYFLLYRKIPDDKK